MIENDRQLQITKAAAAKFAHGLATFDERPEAHPGVHPRLIKAMKAALAGQLKTLQKEIKEYKQMQRRKTPQINLEEMSEIPDWLIRARISSGLSQRELAEKLGLKEQQIQRYESTNYQTASWRRVMEVATALTAQAV